VRKRTWIQRVGSALFRIKLLNEPWATMIRLIHSLVLTFAIAVTTVTAKTAMARSRHYGGPPFDTYFGNPINDHNAGLYNPAKDPNAVYYGGTYAGSDPDPNIRAALIREFGRQMRN
jgi:hypothetical protein